MRKVLALLCTVAMLITMFTSTIMVNAEEVPKMELNPNPPVPGEKVTAVYTQSETPAFFGWYVFDASEVEVKDGVATIKSTADWGKAGIPQYGATINLPATAAGKYLYTKAGRGADQNYTTIQESAVVKVAGGEQEAPKAPPAPEMPTKRITIFGFENVADGVKMGVEGSDSGPTELRRPNGELWNSDASPWASTQYSTFTDLYELVSIQDQNAPEGKRLGKWINKIGETVPSGKGEWTGSLLNLFLDEPRNTYAVGATEFMFWIDATQYYAPNGLTFVPRFSVQQYDDSGKPTSKYATYLPGDKNACYYKNEKGEWIGALVSQSGFFNVPSGYKGYVRIPLEGYMPASWNADAKPVMQLNSVNQVSFYFFTYAGKNAVDTYALMDDFSFIGNDLKEKPAKYYEQPLDPAEGLVGAVGIVGEAAYEDKVEGTKAAIKWDSIGDYSKTYTVNVYKLEKEDDDIGALVNSMKDITDTSVQITGLDKETLYAAQVIAFNAAGERIAIYDYIKFKTTNADEAVGTDNTSTPATDDTAAATDNTKGIDNTTDSAADDKGATATEETKGTDSAANPVTGDMGTAAAAFMLLASTGALVAGYKRNKGK